MYKKGEVQFGDCSEFWNDYQGKGFYLPHSCDEWVIGDKEAALQLIEDLQELIKKGEGL